MQVEYRQSLTLLFWVAAGISFFFAVVMAMKDALNMQHDLRQWSTTAQSSSSSPPPSQHSK